MLALLIGAVAMLGLATGRLVAGQGLAEARNHSQATLLATDMLHRLLANPGQLDAYLVEAPGDSGPVPALERDCRAAPCTPGELARFDLYQGLRQLRGADPGEADRPWQDLPADSRLCLRRAGKRLEVVVVWPARSRGLAGAAPDCGTAAPAETRRQLSLVTWLGEGT